MLPLIIEILLGAGAFLLASKLISGVEFKSFIDAIILTVIVALFNGTIGRVINWFIPNIIDTLTLGFAQFILDAIIIWLAAKFTRGFHLQNFLWAIVLAMAVSFLTRMGMQFIAPLFIS